MAKNVLPVMQLALLMSVVLLSALQTLGTSGHSLFP